MPAAEAHRLNYYHYWRGDDGEWRRSDPLPKPVGPRRPMIVAGKDDSIVIYFMTPEGIMCHVARAEDEWQTWTSLRLTGPEFRFIDVSKPDKRRLREENILSLTVDPRGQEAGTGFSFLDFDLDRLFESR